MPRRLATRVRAAISFEGYYLLLPKPQDPLIGTVKAEVPPEFFQKIRAGEERSVAGHRGG